MKLIISFALLFVFSMMEAQTPGNKVTAIYADAYGCIWLGTDNGLLRKCGDTWTAFNTQFQTPGYVSDLKPQKVGNNHELWMGTKNGITVASYGVDAISSATVYNTANTPLQSNEINAITLDNESNRYFTTPAGVGIFAGSDWQFLTSVKSVSGVPFTDLMAINDTIYIGSGGKGVGRLINDVDGYTGASNYVQPWSALTGDSVTYTFVDSKGYQWYGSNKGIARHTSLKAKEGWDVYLTSQLPNPFVTAIAEDKDGNMLIGTRDGLAKLHPDLTTITVFKTQQGLPHNAINDIYVASADSIWIGTDQGVSRFNGTTFSNIETAQYAKQFQDIVSPTAIDVDAQNMGVELYPVPAMDEITLVLSNAILGKAEVAIFDVTGKIVYRANVQSQTITWNLKKANGQKVPAGIYLIRVENGGKIYRQKALVL